MLLLALVLPAAAGDLVDRPAIARLRTVDAVVLDVRSDRAGWWTASEGAGAHATIEGDIEASSACLTPVSGALSPDLLRAASVDRDGRVCVAGGPRAPKAAAGTLPGKDWRAVILPDAATVVRARADGTLEARGVDGARRWKRRAPVGALRQLRAGATAREVLLVGSEGVALVDTATGRLVRAVFVAGATSAVADVETLWIGDATGGVWRIDRATWRKVAFPLDASASGGPADAAPVRDVDALGRHLAVLGEDGRLRVHDLRRRQLALDAPTDATRVRWTRDATKELRAAELVVMGPARTEVWRAPDLDAIPSRAPEHEPPLHRPLTRPVPGSLLTEQVPLAEVPTLLAGVGVAPRDSTGASGALPLALGPDGVLGRTGEGALGWWRLAPTLGPGDSGGGAVGPRNAPGPTREPAANGTPPAAEVSAILPGSAGASVLALDGERVLAVQGEASSDAVLTMWDGATPVARIPWATDASPPVAGDIGGRLVVVRDGAGGAWAGSGPLQPIRAPGDVTSIAADPQRGRVALGRGDGSVEVRASRVGASTPSRSTQILARAVTALAWSGQTVAAASASPLAPDRPGGGLDADDASGTVALLQQDETPAGEGFSTAGVPTALELDGAHVLARWAGGLAVHARDGSARLQVEEPLVDARLAGDEVRTLDPAGRVRTRRLSTAPLPRVPRAATVVQSPDGRRGATVEGDVVTLWDGRTARVLDVLPPLGAAARALAFRGDITGTDDLLAVLRDDATIDLFDAARGEHRGALEIGGTGEGSELFFGADGSVLWTAARLAQGPVLLGWQVGGGELAAAPTHVVAGQLDGGPMTKPGGAGARFRALVDGRWLDTVGGSVLAGGPAGAPLAVAPDGEVRARATEGALQREDAVSGRAEGAPVRARTTRGAPRPTPRAASWSPDGKLVAVAWSDDTLRIHDLRWGTELRRMPTDVTPDGGAGRPLRTLAFDPVDPGVVVGTDTGGRVRAFAWKVDRERPAPPRDPGAVTRVAGASALVADPARGRVLTAHDDGTIRAWDTGTGTQVALLSGHAGAVRALRVVGDRIFSLGDDGTIRAWDATTGAERAAASTYGVGLVGWHGDVGADGVLGAVGADGRPRSWRWTGAGFEDPRVGSDRIAVSAATTLARERLGGAAFGAPRTWLSVGDTEAPGAATLWTLGSDGKLRVWGGEPASYELRATMTPLSDGSWILDRLDGTRLASPSLRDRTAPSLRP